MGKTLVVAASLMLASACASDELPRIDGHEVQAVAAPWGPVYFGQATPSPSIVAHEKCHMKQIYAYAPGPAAYYIRYVRDKRFACQQERECGWYGPHPMC